MKITRRQLLGGVVGGAAAAPILGLSGPLAQIRSQGGDPRMEEGTVRYVRFEQAGRRSWGLVDGREIREIIGKPWEGDARSGAVFPLPAVRIVAPAEPTKVLALAGNYRSHLGGATPFANPEVFFKPPSSIADPDGTIVIPPGTTDVHYEGELVVVMGKRAKAVSREEAAAAVFGVTCGNDVSARDWQRDDKQWWRAKGCDTFGPVGPFLVRGLKYGDLKLTTRLNGEVKQEARTSELIFDIPAVVSFVSRHVTLLPGDLIFTGTPGTTTAMKPGDAVEVEIEGIGVLKNRVG